MLSVMIKREEVEAVSGPRRTLGCKVCGNEFGNRTHESREMMLGLGGSFTYLECSSCGCLALENRPADLAPYYPNDYSSFVRNEKGFRGLAKGLRVLSYFRRGSVFGAWLVRRYPRPDLASMARMNFPKTWRILDVGCGAGKLLLELSDLGYRNLTGVDPFVTATIRYPNGIEIRKCFLGEVEEGGWDLIMFHHSLEHIPDQFETLKSVAALLGPNGTCLIRIPVVGWAWENYQTDWVQLDAPRHFFLHTEKSFRLLAQAAGLKVIQVEYDSFEFQFWGSELYRRGITLKTAGVPRRFFSAKEFRRFRRKSQELNAAGAGDQAVFVLGLC
jgi:SAM-dependent methyltransferase